MQFSRTLFTISNTVYQSSHHAQS